MTFFQNIHYFLEFKLLSRDFLIFSALSIAWLNFLLALRFRFISDADDIARRAVLEWRHFEAHV